MPSGKSHSLFSTFKHYHTLFQELTSSFIKKEMMAISRTIFFLFIPLVLFCLSGCKKDKAKIIEGILLYSKTNPEPVTNYTLEMYQRGGNAIIMGSSSSSATATTDNAGRFRFEFTPGKAYFAGIPLRNGAHTSLNGQSTNKYPATFRDVFPDSTFIANTTIYLVKEIQQYIVQIKALRNLIPSDTIVIRVSTNTGEIERLYTGLTYATGSVTIIDTIPKVIATNLRIINGGYQNPFWLPSSSSTSRRAYFTYSENIGIEDEERRTCEIVIY